MSELAGSRSVSATPGRGPAPRKTKLIYKPYKQVLEEAYALVEDGRKYPEGSARRSDLFREALTMMEEWHRDNPEAEEP